MKWMLHRSTDDIVLYKFISSEYRDYIAASLSTRDIARNMVRVKSSNIWSYTLNVKKNKNRHGDLYIQFKGRNGGPDDVYVYYDVPTRLYQKLVAAPSKGHFFWRYIRNNFTYAKLTGDKKTHLPNGI